MGAQIILSVMERMPNVLLSLGAQAASGTMNAIVTNVPGPQFPLYMLGAPMLRLYPQVPLLPSGGIGIALISYNGQVCWGFNADLGLVPDLPDFVAMIRRSMQRLADAADVKLTPPASRDED
jgi:diacylglycerol O-acyltransferase